MTEHKHADILRAIADGVPANEFEFKPQTSYWETYENSAQIFRDLAEHDIPSIRGFQNEIRRKQRTININGFEVPEPLRDPPILGDVFYVVDFSCIDEIDYFVWSGDLTDLDLLRLGIAHKTKEAAELHAKALLSFTEVKEATV